MELKVLSWNIWYGKYLDKILRYLKKEDAEILCLQEIVANKDGSNNTAEIIAKKLDYQFFEYSFALEIEKDEKPLDWGNAILSKYPIIGKKTHVLSSTDKRIALQVDINLEGRSLHVFTTHLIHTHQIESEIQNMQADILFDSVSKTATILTGDFNAIPESYPLKRITRKLTNADDKGRPTFSLYPEGCCPTSGLEYRLDYIFVSSDIEAKSCEVGKSKGSDHLPITAIVNF